MKVTVSGVLLLWLVGDRRRLEKTYKHKSEKVVVLLALTLIGIVITFLLEFTTPCMGTMGSICLHGTELDERTKG